VTRLSPADLTTHSGIRVTSVARTILDLTSLVSPRTLERTLDEALRKGQVTLDGLRRCIQRNGRRGRTGVAHLDALLSERRDQRAPDSLLESDFAAMIRQSRFMGRAFIDNRELGRMISASRIDSSCTGGSWQKLLGE